MAANSAFALEQEIWHVEKVRVVFIRPDAIQPTSYDYTQVGRGIYDVSQRVIKTVGKGHPFIIVDKFGQTHSYRGLDV